MARAEPKQMNRIERVAAWIVAVGAILTGILAVATRRLGQGGVSWPAAPIRGPLAVVFGTGLTILGVYFVIVLVSNRANSIDKKS